MSLVVQSSSQQVQSSSSTVVVVQSNGIVIDSHKDRLIASLKQEAVDSRHRDRNYTVLYEQLLSLEQHFQRLQDEKRRLDEEYRNRIDSNLVYISSLRSETDDYKSILTDRKKQNSDLYIESERNRETLDQRSLELTRVRVELQQ
jgi:hypothetical protein